MEKEESEKYEGSPKEISIKANRRKISEAKCLYLLFQTWSSDAGSKCGFVWLEINARTKEVKELFHPECSFCIGPLSFHDAY